jgi:hypothetical protein
VLIVVLFFRSPQRSFTEISLKQKLLEMDVVGAGFLISAIVCLLLSLQWGGLQYPWSDSKVWGCMLGFFLLIALFIALQLRLGDRATIPPRILKQRTILATALTLAFMSMGLFTSVRSLAGGSLLTEVATFTTCLSTSKASRAQRPNNREFVPSRTWYPIPYLP